MNFQIFISWLAIRTIDIASIKTRYTNRILAYTFTQFTMTTHSQHSLRLISVPSQFHHQFPRKERSIRSERTDPSDLHVDYKRPNIIRCFPIAPEWIYLFVNDCFADWTASCSSTYIDTIRKILPLLQIIITILSFSTENLCATFIVDWHYIFLIYISVAYYRTQTKSS